MRLGVACALTVVAVLLLVSAALAADRDGDGVDDTEDNCPAAFNPDQIDDDEDDQGNTCDETPGVAAGQSRVVFYLRDELGQPVTGACLEFVLTTSAGTQDPTELCAEEDAPGWLASDLLAADHVEEIRQSTRPPGCSGGLAAPFTHRFAGGSWTVLTVRFRCAGAPRTFTDTFTAPGQVKPHAVSVSERVKRARILLRWTKPSARFDIVQIKLVRRANAGTIRLKPGRLKISKRRRATSVEVRVSRLKPGTLRFRVRANRVSGETRTTTRVTQAR